MNPTYSTRNPRNKKHRIRELICDGKYSASEIASIVGTTVEYVWKETSRYKKASIGNSLVVSKTTQLSKRKAQTSIILQSDQMSNRGIQDFSASKSQPQLVPVDSIYLNDKPEGFLNLPKMEQKDLKILYKEFSHGKKPVDLIANHGYHPEIVEFEFRRFLRLSGKDSDELLNHIVADCSTYLEPRDDLKRLINKYHNEGTLQNEDIYEVLQLKSEHEWQSRLGLSMLNPSEDLPRDIGSLRCIQCKTPISGVLLQTTSDIGKQILNQFCNVLCYSCMHPTSLDEMNDMRTSSISISK